LLVNNLKYSVYAEATTKRIFLHTDLNDIALSFLVKTLNV